MTKELELWEGVGFVFEAGHVYEWHELPPHVREWIEEDGDE